MVPNRKDNEKDLIGHKVTVSEPLDFLRSITYQQREVSLILEAVVDGKAMPEAVIDACQFLSVELFLHLHDESEDVVPMLRARCKPDDNIEPVIQDLSQEHSAIKLLSLKVSKTLMSQVAKKPGRKAGKILREQAKELIEGLRRLSAIENGIILPIARARFSNTDLEELSLRMAMRRGWAT